MVEEEKDSAHYGREAERYEGVELQPRAHHASGFPFLSSAVEGSYERGHACGETYLHHDRHHEDVVDEGSRRKFVKAVGAHHHRVGEADDDNAHLRISAPYPPATFLFSDAPAS